MGVHQDLEAQIHSLQREIAMLQPQIKMNLQTSALLTQTAVIPSTWGPPSGATRPWPLNCPNCGAPVGGWKCEYCGTRFD